MKKFTLPIGHRILDRRMADEKTKSMVTVLTKWTAAIDENRPVRVLVEIVIYSNRMRNYMFLVEIFGDSERFKNWWKIGGNFDLLPLERRKRENLDFS